MCPSPLYAFVRVLLVGLKDCYIALRGCRTGGYYINDAFTIVHTMCDYARHTIIIIYIYTNIQIIYIFIYESQNVEFRIQLNVM